MKKVLMGSFVLTVLSASIILFQISCSKSADAQSTTNGLTQLNLILFEKINNGITPRTTELWTANIDGTNQKKINISLTTGLTISEGEAKLSPDGKTVVFSVNEQANNRSHIYTCSIDGTNLKRIIDFGTTNIYAGLDGAY